MSSTETTETYEPVHYVHRRTEVDAIAYDGTEHARRAIVAWVHAGGGQAHPRATGDLLVWGARGWLPVLPREDHVVRSIMVPGRGREFFPMGTDVLTEAYDRGENHAAVVPRETVDGISQALAYDPETPVDRDQLVAWCRLLVVSHEALR